MVFNRLLLSRVGRRLFSDSSALNKRNNSIGRLIGKDLKDKVSIQQQQNKTTSLNRIVAACTAESYNFAKLLPFLQKNFSLSPFICDEVLHVQIPSEKGQVFFFKNGSMVFWSTDSEDVDEETLMKRLKTNLLPKIKPFEISPFDEPDFEELDYKFGGR